MSGRSEKHEKLAALGLKVLTQARNELFLSMRYLEPVFRLLPPRELASVQMIGTDGISLLYQPMLLTKRFQYDPVLVNRAYLHTMLHGLLRHLETDGQKVDTELWNLACDVAVEHIIDHLDYACVKRLISDERERFYQICEEKLKVITAEGVYHLLMHDPVSDRELISLGLAFLVDDHQFWHEEGQEERKQEQMQEFRDASEKMRTAMETYLRDQGEKAGSLLRAIGVKNRAKTNYRDFLRKFAQIREEMKIDTDAFDYIFYHFGMEMYGNMPLIEELEYKEELSIDEFVIAIDTSGSTAGEMVERFLAETHQILTEVTAGSRKCHLCILQADAEVQEAVMIHDRREMEAYLNTLTIRGYGGTDFRPVFTYVEKLRESGELKNLRGLIYYTDGYGTYPSRRPAYPTAFVFTAPDAVLEKVPAWAMKVILDANERVEESHASESRQE